jgi:DNA-directed RNA polymerase specialized sigma24 family protein
MTQTNKDNQTDESWRLDDQALKGWREITDSHAEQTVASPSATSTSWTLITDAVNEDSSTRTESKDALVKRYWQAVYAFVRASGRSAILSEDLTQGFFCDVFLGRELLERAESARGRFRSLLLSSVRNYLADDFRMRTAKCRTPAHGKLMNIEGDEQFGANPDESGDPEAAFNTVWVEELIGRTAKQVEQDLVESGQSIHWKILQDRVLIPCLNGGTPTPHEDLANQWGLKGVPQVSNMLVTAKRRFARRLLENVRETLPENYAPSTELDELYQALGN